MRKLFLLILLIPLFTNAQQVEIQPRAALSIFTTGGYNTYLNSGVGFIKDGQLISQLKSHNGNFMFKTGIVISWKKFSFINDASIYCNKERWDQTSFDPRLAIWDFSLNYSLTNKLKISYVHQCIHPILSGDIENRQNSISGGYEGFTVSYGY